MQSNPPPSEKPNNESLDSRLSQVWELLGIKTYSPEDTDESFKYWQDEVMESLKYAIYQEDVGKKDFETLERSSKAWKSWRDSNVSGMLVLAGVNIDCYSTHGWLSPVALRIVKTLRERKQEEQEKETQGHNTSLYAFYKWRYHSRLEPKLARISVPDALAQLLAQLVV